MYSNALLTSENELMPQNVI